METEIKIQVWRGYIMIIEPMIVTDKIGRSIVLRNAEEDDAASLIKFMKITTGETPIFNPRARRVFFNY